MFNLSSPQDKVSNFIVNNAYLVKLKVNVQIWIKTAMLWQKKNKYKFYDAFT